VFVCRFTWLGVLCMECDCAVPLRTHARGVHGCVLLVCGLVFVCVFRLAKRRLGMGSMGLQEWLSAKSRLSALKK
jgi:hypothetical protein